MPVGYTTVSAGFEVGADSYIDRRLLLTKEQMRGAYDEWFMPPVYIAYCLDDKQWYEYNEENEEDAETGYYRPIPSGIVKDVRIEGVSILDSEGIADFEFPVKDVLVDGVSVVENKRAQIDLTDLQKKLIPGEGIEISDSNVISSTAIPLEGEGIKVDSEGHISIDKEIVPVKDELEELVEDLGFITADAVNNLLNNYYTDSEVYNKTEIQNLLNQLTGGVTMEVVAVLPITGEADKIYLVRRSIDSNVYDQYIWFNNAWVQVGSTEIDLSQYYTKTEVDNLLSNKQDKLTAGQGITITGNTVSVDANNLPTATTSTLGLVKIDNDTIRKNADGQLYAVGGGGEGTTYYEGENIYFTRSGGKDYINAEGYTAGPGVTITSGKQIKAKVDDVTIHTNTTGELYMDAVPIDAGNGIKIQNGTISIVPSEVKDAIDLADYQKKLVAGDNIIIDPTTNVISSTGGGGSGGTTNWGSIGGTLSNQPDLWAALQGKANTADIPTNVSQLTNDVPYATQSALNNMGLTKQDKLTAGANITISADNVISATGGGSGPTEVNWTDVVGDPMSNAALAQEINNAKTLPVVNNGNFLFKANGTSVGGANMNQATSSSAGITLQKNGAAITPTVASNNATYNIKMPIFSYDESTGVLSITDN